MPLPELPPPDYPPQGWCWVEESGFEQAEPRFSAEVRAAFPALSRHRRSRDPRVVPERALPCVEGAPPPEGDIPPTTPEFDQLWRDPFPDGFGVSAVQEFPGVKGEHSTIVDIEYAWDLAHEDLAAVDPEAISGLANPQWAFHGNGVLGILVGGDNGFGVMGVAPEAATRVAHPEYPAFPGLDYDVARAIGDSLMVLVPGDVILIEQQVYGPDLEYLPVIWDRAVRDAIRVASAAGVVVVVPAGNGAINLDDPVYEGVFTESTGAILVGAGGSSISDDPRGRSGSNYGSMLTVQGWWGDIVTTGGDSYHDLYFPNDDVNQAYTANFGGTSGASAIVAGLVASVQSMAIETRGSPFTPVEVSLLLRRAADAGELDLGGQPNLLRLARTWLLP